MLKIQKMQIEINGTKFEHGDEILIIQNYEILTGKISIENENNYFICHNNTRYDYNRVVDDLGYKYAMRIHEFALHISDLKIEFGNTSHLKNEVHDFIGSFELKIYYLFFLNLGIIDGYEYITKSEQQGFVELHSRKRKKKLSIKLGRLIRKLNAAFNEIILKNSKNVESIITDAKIEEIHNLWMSSHENAIKYELLNGKDILKGYNGENYSKYIGSLGNSCMVNKFGLLKLYIDNPDKISLLVFYDTNNMICGRCLIWNCDDGITYFDRIYHTYDWYGYNMKNICKKLGYEEIYCSTTKTSVSLKRIDYDNYPYLDTFYGASFKNKILTNKNTRYNLRSTIGEIIENNKIQE